MPALWLTFLFQGEKLHQEKQNFTLALFGIHDLYVNTNNKKVKWEDMICFCSYVTQNLLAKSRYIILSYTLHTTPQIARPNITGTYSIISCAKYEYDRKLNSISEFIT